MSSLVDTSVLLDIFNNDTVWTDWSQAALAAAAGSGPLMINDVVYAELVAGFPSREYLDAAIAALDLQLVPMPREALFMAGKAHLRYRRQGGTRTGVLSDFFIGAHAAAENWPLVTRDTLRVRAYFPDIALIAP